MIFCLCIVVIFVWMLNIIYTILHRGEKDGGRGSRMWAHLLPQIIDNPSTCGTLCPEILLNADKKIQDSNRKRKTSWNWVGQKEEEKQQKKEKQSMSGPALLRGSRQWKNKKKQKQNCTPWKVPTPGRRPAETEEELGSVGGEHSNQCKALQMEMECHCPVLPNLKLGQTGARNWNSSFGEWTQTEGWGWLCGEKLGLVAWREPGGTAV